MKRRIRQHLLLRGGGNFASEELAAMGDTIIADLADYRELMVSVRNDSTIRIHKMVDSVPCRLIGVRLLARIHENHIVLLVGALEVARLPLLRGDRGAVIDFRHLIGHLLGKPGAFAGYRWREELFPSLGYRAAYDQLERVGVDVDGGGKRLGAIAGVPACGRFGKGC